MLHVKSDQFIGFAQAFYAYLSPSGVFFFKFNRFQFWGRQG